MNSGKKESITVVIPTKDRSEFLSGAIRSVLEQTYPALEIIVVENGVSEQDADYSGTEIKDLDKKNEIKVTHYKITETGANIARQFGVEKSRGDYIAFLDDDDLWKQHKLEKQLESMCESGANFSYTGKEISSKYRNYYSFSLPEEENKCTYIAKKNFVGTFSTILMTKDLFWEVGGLWEELPCFQDYEFYLRCMCKADVAPLNEALITYRQHFGFKISSSYQSNKIASRMIVDVYKDDERLGLIRKNVKHMMIRKGIKYLNIGLLVFGLRFK